MLYVKKSSKNKNKKPHQAWNEKDSKKILEK